MDSIDFQTLFSVKGSLTHFETQSQEFFFSLSGMTSETINDIELMGLLGGGQKGNAEDNPRNKIFPNSVPLHGSTLVFILK